ncbi:phage holin family protein [Methylococcus sp. EFPC2]|uniref:phage holin family protein n=1 Tax=Methylococcus sp. EFPC2 TaxID=2812648 RepID=UPI001968564B|nr:phage holin family protein [Methylococcus sp. EFPC2]QSA97746.1 phage holin family protein [Methylococcus sp. EFPC2]
MDDMPRHDRTRADQQSGSGVLEMARSLWHELRGLSHDRLRLAGLETRRAGESLVVMIASALMLAVLLNGAWIGLVAAGVLELIEHGVTVTDAILFAVACNLLLALILCGVIRRKSRYLQFPATLRSLDPLPMERQEGERV